VQHQLVSRNQWLMPRFAEGDAMRVIGLGERYDAATRERIPELWARLQQRLDEVRGRSDPAQFGVVYSLSDRRFEFEYLAGVMVDEDTIAPAGFVERRLPARRHAVFSHRGDLAGLRPLVQAIFCEWLPRSDHKAAGNPDLVEVYGEDFDPLRLRGVVEVWVPLE
jgi:AraC family transcriptional regulator